MAIVDFDLAILLYIEDIPTSHELHAYFYNRGVCYSNLMEYGKALGIWTKPFNCIQRQAPAHYFANRATKVKEKLGLPAEAIEDHYYARTLSQAELSKHSRAK